MSLEETIAILLGWAVQLSSYTMPDEPPRVEYRPAQFFVEQVCRSEPCRTLGWYNHQGTVFIDDRLQGRDDRYTRSLLVHEFVHYLQDRSGQYDNTDCSQHAQREREAYSIQREYVAKAYGQAAFIRMVLPPCHLEQKQPSTTDANS